MKLYKSFYAVLLGISAIHFCTWGMENPLQKSIIQTNRFFGESETPDQPSDIFTQSTSGSIFEKKDQDYDNFKKNCQKLIKSLNTLEEISEEEKPHTLNIESEKKKKSIITRLSHSMDFIIRRDKSVENPQKSLRVQSLNEIKDALEKKNLPINGHLIKQWKNSIANSCRLTIDNIDKIKAGENTENLEHSSLSPLFAPQEIQQFVQVSNLEKINTLKEEVAQLKDNSAKYNTYKSIIDDLQQALKTNDLTPDEIKVIHYTIKMVNRVRIENIIKEINQEPISLESKIYILTKLSTLPRLSIPLEAKPITTRSSLSPHTKEVNKPQTNQLKASKLQAEWNKKKIQLKQDLEQKIIKNYEDQDIDIEFDKTSNTPISLVRWKNYRKALRLYNNILDKDDARKKNIEAKIQNVEKSIEEKIQNTKKRIEEKTQTAEKKIRTKELELTLGKQAAEIKTKRKNNEPISLDELENYKNNLEKYIEELGKFTGDKALSEKEKRTKELQLISQRIEELKNKRIESENQQFQELIAQQAQKKIEEAQEKLTKEQKKLDREELNSIEDELSILEDRQASFKKDIASETSALERSYKGIQDLEKLQQKYPNSQKISNKLEKYNNFFADEAKHFIEKIPFAFTSAAVRSKQIDTYFPADNKDLAVYREMALKNLTSKIINELGQKNVINYTLQDKTSTIENILLLARNFNYLNEEQKALFNQQNNLNRLFNTASYDILEEAIKPEEKEKFKQAWDAIREKVGYVSFKTESTQPSEQQTIKQPINVDQKQPEQKPINTPSTQPVQLSPEKLKIEQNIQNQKEELEKEKQNLEKKVKQQEEELKSLKQENRGFFATIRGAISGFFNAIVDYLRSWWPF